MSECAKLLSAWCCSVCEVQLCPRVSLFRVQGAARGDSVSSATEAARLPCYALPRTVTHGGVAGEEKDLKIGASCTAHTWEFRVVLSCVCTLRVSTTLETLECLVSRFYFSRPGRCAR